MAAFARAVTRHHHEFDFIYHREAYPDNEHYARLIEVMQALHQKS
jgi:hypothetical protein